MILEWIIHLIRVFIDLLQCCIEYITKYGIWVVLKIRYSDKTYLPRFQYRSILGHISFNLYNLVVKLNSRELLCFCSMITLLNFLVRLDKQQNENFSSFRILSMREEMSRNILKETFILMFISRDRSCYSYCIKLTWSREIQ